jgi:hypothetical protein
MTKPETTKSLSLIGLIFVIAGALILVLAFLNYMQDGRINLHPVMGLVLIFLGIWLYSYGKRPKG